MNFGLIHMMLSPPCWLVVGPLDAERRALSLWSLARCHPDVLRPANLRCAAAALHQRARDVAAHRPGSTLLFASMWAPPRVVNAASARSAFQQSATPCAKCINVLSKARQREATGVLLACSL